MAPPPQRLPPRPSLFRNAQHLIQLQPQYHPQQPQQLPHHALNDVGAIGLARGRVRSCPPTERPSRPEPARSIDNHTKKKKKRSRNGTQRDEHVDRSQTRKPSHVLRREERDELAKEAHTLETVVEALRLRVGLPTRADKAAVDDTKAQNVDLEERLHMNDRYLGRLHSLVTHELLETTIHPMSTCIHLPRDMAQRRAILRSMQDLKLRRGIDVATQRLHHVDHTQPYVCEEKFTTPSGEYHFSRYEIHQFPNFQTARQLYDAFVHFLSNMEISVTEMLGQLTLREDAHDVDDDPTIWNHRFVTVAENVGCSEELNVVGFAQFYQHSPHTNSPMGVVVYDTVQVDELYPYRPMERTCKDVQAVNMACEVLKPGTTTGETMVVLKQCSFVVQLAPQFSLAPHALQQLHDNVSRWPNAIVKYLHDYAPIATTASAQ